LTTTFGGNALGHRKQSKSAAFHRGKAGKKLHRRRKQSVEKSLFKAHQEKMLRSFMLRGSFEPINSERGTNPNEG
jgi:hypothetical protein